MMAKLTLKQIRNLVLRGVIPPSQYLLAKRLRKMAYTPLHGQNRFNFSSYSDRESNLLFRFTPEEIVRIFRALRVPRLVILKNKARVPGLEALCILLRRLCYPNSLSDLCKTFGRDITVLSRTITWMVNWMYTKYSSCLQTLQQPWMPQSVWSDFAEVCSEAGSVYPNIVGFIDGTCRPICRPSKDQKKYYSGYYKEHVVKYQVYIAEVGRWNFRAILSGEESMAKFKEHAAEFYNAVQQSENGAIIILDLQNFDPSPLLSQAGGKFLEEQIANLDSNTGAGLKHLYVVNGNQVSADLFNAYKSNFGINAERISIFGKNSTQWSPELLQYLNIDVKRMMSSATLSPLQAILAEEFPAKYRAKFPYYLNGYSPEGSPVFTSAMGRYDFKSVVDEGPQAMEIFGRLFTQMFLRVYTDGIQAPGSPGSIYIVDIKGFSPEQTKDPQTRQLMLNQFRKFDRICSGPGFRLSYIINVNDAWRGLFSEAIPGLKNTLSRMEVYGEDVTEWTAALRNALRPPLPEEYGGVQGYSPLITY